MTTTHDSDLRRNAITARLDTLLAEREWVAREAAPEFSGDDADRATNVDAHVRLSDLDDRIEGLTQRLAAREYGSDDDDGTIHEGDLVMVDLGDGPEEFMLAPVDECPAGYTAVTPGSPLGHALLGAEPGATVEYTAGRRRLRAVISPRG